MNYALKTLKFRADGNVDGFLILNKEVIADFATSEGGVVEFAWRKWEYKLALDEYCKTLEDMNAEYFILTLIEQYEDALEAKREARAQKSARMNPAEA